MGTKSWAAREQSSLELLNYGFRFFDTTSLFGTGKPAQTARVYKGKLDSIAVGTLAPVALALPRGSADKLQVRAQINQPVIAPLHKEIGRAHTGTPLKNAHHVRPLLL